MAADFAARGFNAHIDFTGRRPMTRGTLPMISPAAGTAPPLAPGCEGFDAPLQAE